MNVSGKIDPDDFSIGELKTYQFGTLQAVVSRVLKKHADDQLKEFNITGAQWQIIGLVYDHEPNGIRISDLASQFDTTLAFLTNNVNSLESSGILMRVENDQDARSRLVRITPSFLPNCAKIETALRAKLRQSIYSQLTPDEFHAYIKALAKLTEM